MKKARQKYYPQAHHYLGQYKKSPNSVVSINHQTGATHNVLVTADPGNVTQIAMQTLLDWYRQAIEEHVCTMAVACEFVFRFLAIHPFQDGNGRIGRGLFTLALLQSPILAYGSVAPYLPIDRSIEETRQEYYTVLRQCSNGAYQNNPKDYRIEFFLNYMIKMMNRSLEAVPIYSQKFRNQAKLSTLSKKILQCFKEKPELRLQTKELLTELKIPRRTLTYHLNQMTQKGFLQKYGEGRATEYQLIF